MSRIGNALGFVGVTLSVLALVLGRPAVVAAERRTTHPTHDGKLRILGIGGHPDDCELKMGGVAAMWAAQGHHVKFVSVTNGDLGHWRMAGGELALRRAAEVRKAANILGIDEVQVLDNPDGQLTASLENRKTITRLIRRWKPDIVLTHRMDHYHPDNRYTGILVQDASFMVAVPNYCPDVPPLRKSPVYLYFADSLHFSDPTKIADAVVPDLVVSVDEVFQKKVDALLALESQFIEGGCCWHEGLGRPGGEPPKTPAELAERRRQATTYFQKWYATVANQCRGKLIELYGREKGEKVRYAEAFKICPNSPQPSKAELKRLFPFFEP